MRDIEVRTLAELEQTGDVCAWPRPALLNGAGKPKPRRGNCDTTKINMGRRQNAKCCAWMCSRRVDGPDDDYCRICVARRAVAGHTL